MAKKKKGKSGHCTYCGGLGAVTDDHVPPQNLFPKGFRPPSVPACFACNNGASADDEHFRAAIAIREGAAETSVVQEILPKVLRGMTRTGVRGNTGTIVRTLGQAPHFTASGVYAGIKHTYQVEDVRICRVLARVVRGLHFLNTGTRLPDTHGVMVQLLAKLNTSDVNVLALVDRLSKFAVAGRVGFVHPDVFKFAVNSLPDHDSVSVWTMSFYGEPTFMCITAARADFADAGRAMY